MPSSHFESLEMRAARYFGVHDEPRTSIRLGRDSCLLVVRRESSRRVLAVYEDGRGTYSALTDIQRAKLLAALEQ